MKVFRVCLAFHAMNLCCTWHFRVASWQEKLSRHPGKGNCREFGCREFGCREFGSQRSAAHRGQRKCAVRLSIRLKYRIAHSCFIFVTTTLSLRSKPAEGRRFSRRHAETYLCRRLCVAGLPGRNCGLPTVIQGDRRLDGAFLRPYLQQRLHRLSISFVVLIAIKIDCWPRPSRRQQLRNTIRFRPPFWTTS
jgi:hypothetical protein